ncbi:MAG: DUF2169 family type VI secretion system accessory protein [Gammaproteobacteria bacterium]
MQITSNTTPFLAELFASTDKDGVKRCVVVVKATFDVAPDGECQPAGEQAPFVYADEHHGDPGTTAIRYESDFAPVKPRADVLVNGNAIAPKGQAVTALEVALAGPGFATQAVVTGDRIWVEGLRGIEPSHPRPFATMPLVWDRGFGGSDQSHEEVTKNGSELRNLVGVGFHLNGDKRSILGQPLPNIERLDSRMRSWFDKPEPIGFGPVGRGWQPRIGFAGTYDQRWMDERLPFLPEDFDDRYFQSAPLDQQLSQLAVGAAFGCRNMSEGGQFLARLPPLNIPVRFFFDDRTESSAVAPDTLILEPGAKRLILVGRVGVLLPRKITALREIQVGQPKRMPSTGKPHYSNLGEAVTALKRSR